MPNGPDTRAPRAWTWIAILILGSILVWGLEEIAVAPFETGEVYPPYSSLRSDPLGAKVLYESLSVQSDIAVERLYKPRSTLQLGSSAIFVMGVDPVSWAASEDKTLDEYEKLIGSGGRLVIAFLPVRAPAAMSAKESRLEQRWRIKLAYQNGRAAEQGRDAIPRQSALYFDPAPEWNVLSRRAGRATAVERGFGGGTIVLVADSYFLSNEGLREARDTELISRLVGPAREIIFDENHFGVVETGSVVKLMRKYRLTGAVLVLAIVAGLFLWRNASAFLPPRPSRAAKPVAGFDSLEGLAALLRRGIATKDLLDTCFAEWRKSAPRESRAARVEEEISRLGKRDPVTAYRAACGILNSRGTEKG